MVSEYRVSPYFSKEQIKLIDDLVNKIGCSRADVVKQLVLIKLTGMGYFNKEKIK
ncbi:MAG TPA: hypothetical protein P5530_03665 [Candidatus Diapherotrites archaeon]|nr:hypothetical protein [Candidatus Diapherotrites archaeon]